MGASGTDALPWSWKECTLLRVYEAYEFCLTLRAPRSEKSAGRPSEGGFEGIEKVFAAVGLGGAAQPQPARRGMLSRDLFESPNGATSRRSSAANGHGNGQEVITPPPEALVHEKSMAEGDKIAPLKNLPYPFPGFGPRDGSEQEQIPFPPSPAVPEGSAGGHEQEDEDEEVEGDIVVEVEDEEEEEEEEGEDQEFNPRSSEEPSSFSGRGSNSLSSLGQPVPSRYPFAFRHPARGGSMSSTGSPPFAFSRATATPQSKSVSTRESRETRSSGNAETTTASSSPSAGSPVSAVSPTSSVPSPQDVRGMPMPPRHPAAGAGSRQRPSTAPSPVSPTPAGGLTTTRPRRTFEGHRRQLRQSIGSEVVPESDREDDRPPRSGQPSPDGSLEAREREDSVGLLSAPSSQPSPRASVFGSRNGSATSLARISGAFRSRSRSRNTSSGSGSGGSSRHNSHVSVSSASLALGRARAHSLIHGIGSASRSSIELVLGRVSRPGSPPATGAVRLGDTSDVDGSEGALSNPESHTFGLPVVGGAGSLLPRRAGVRARTLESDPGRSFASVSSSSSAAAATAAVAAAMTARAGSARGQVVSPEPRSSGSRMRSSTSLSSERERQGIQLHSAHSFGSQGSQHQGQQEETPPSPSILSQSVRSEDTTSGSTTTRTVTLAQAMSQAPTRAQTPAGVPIPSSPSLPPQSSPDPPGDLSTAPTSFVTAPTTIVSRTTDSGGDGRTPEM
jgi:hypothetical protein